MRSAPRRWLIAMVAVAVLGAAAVLPRAWQPQARAETVPMRSPVTVSLTYDDGTSDQLEAATIMARHGMTGTFYINSSRLGAAGRLDVADVVDLERAGNEIGGHSVTHADLPTLTADEQARQICNDRSALIGHGLHVRSFAYPYGDDNAEVQQVAANCGYNSARVVGDIVSPGSCYGCPFAEQIPPANPYAIKTPDSIKPSSTLENMQNYVLQAEQGGGGWVVIVMHRVCDDCDPYAVTPAKLDGFLSWLSERSADGTVVRNVGDVIGGVEAPAVSGPPPATRGDTSELLRNASMDTDTSGDGIPDCWQRGGYGDNAYTWSNAAEPRSAPAAMQVTINRFVNGDRRIMTPQDLGACAPDIVGGHTYQVTGWYRLSGSGRLVAYYRDAANRWIYLAQGPLLPTSTAWASTTWTTPAMPAGASALSVGLSLRSVGAAAADDFSAMDTDQTPPTVALTSPIDGSRVRGTAAFAATASDDSGIHHVDFLVNGQKECTSTAAPYRCSFDTTAYPDTVIAVTARAVDTAGNSTASVGRNYTVSNTVPVDSVAPTVTLTGPEDGSSVSQEIALTADAADEDTVSRVLFYVDGTFFGAARSAPYTLPWDTRSHPDGPVTLQAKALDISGNLGSSEEITVTVNNYHLDTIPPGSQASCNGTACGADWYNTPVSVALAATDDASGVARTVMTTDGSEPTATNGSTYTGPFEVSTSSTVKYRSWDKAGNVEPVRTLHLDVDTVAPTARVSAPPAAAKVSGVTYIKADVADANGIARVYFHLDGKLLGSRIGSPFQWRWDTTTTTPGTHTLQVTAVDPAKNQTKSETVTVTVS